MARKKTTVTVVLRFQSQQEKEYFFNQFRTKDISVRYTEFRCSGDLNSAKVVDVEPNHEEIWDQ